VATTAPYYLITHERVEKAMLHRDKQLVLFDLSNPRTVEDTVGAIENVKLFNIDKIAKLVQDNIKTRKNEIASAEKIIDEEMKLFGMALKRKEAEPMVISIFKDVDKIREREFKKAISILGNKIGPEEHRIIEQLSYAIVEAVMASPMNRLRKEIGSDKSEDIKRIVARLFNYNEDRQV
jgi:glutamyl-tRNA reductase